MLQSQPGIPGSAVDREWNPCISKRGTAGGCSDAQRDNYLNGRKKAVGLSATTAAAEGGGATRANSCSNRDHRQTICTPPGHVKECPGPMDPDKSVAPGALPHDACDGARRLPALSGVNGRDVFRLGATARSSECDAASAGPSHPLRRTSVHRARDPAGALRLSQTATPNAS